MLEIICSPAFSLFNVYCSSLLSTDTAAKRRKDDCEKLSRSTMTSFNLETRSYFKKGPRSSTQNDFTMIVQNLKNFT